MTARVVASDVKAILDNTELKESVINVYITTANNIVNTVLGTGTTDILKEIERWLTAHLIAFTRERQAIREEAGGTRIDYTGAFATGLRATTYGQTVILLDTTGKMAAYDGRRLASVFAIPTDYTEED